MQHSVAWQKSTLTEWQNAIILADMTHLDIIEALGGCKQVASDLGIPNANTVLYWTRDGRSIPPSRFPEIANLPSAKRQGITVEFLFNARASRKTSEAA